MPGEAHGEFIQLLTDCGSPYLDEFYVRGHVSDAEFGAALRSWWLDYEAEEPPEHGPIRRVYARWSIDANMEDIGGLAFVEYSEPGPGGRFPVTAATDASVLEAQAKWKRLQDEGRREVLSRYPDVNVEHAHRDDAGVLRVTFRLPTPHHIRVEWRSDTPESVWVTPCWIPKWEAYKAGLKGAPDA